MEAENVPHSIRSCKDCVHKMVCEARRTLYRSLTQFDKEFGDMVDIGVIHNENDSCIDLLEIGRASVGKECMVAAIGICSKLYFL